MLGGVGATNMESVTDACCKLPPPHPGPPSRMNSLEVWGACLDAIETSGPGDKQPNSFAFSDEEDESESAAPCPPPAWSTHHKIPGGAAKPAVESASAAGNFSRWTCGVGSRAAAENTNGTCYPWQQTQPQPTPHTDGSLQTHQAAGQQTTTDPGGRKRTRGIVGRASAKVEADKSEGVSSNSSSSSGGPMVAVRTTTGRGRKVVGPMIRFDQDEDASQSDVSSLASDTEDYAPKRKQRGRGLTGNKRSGGRSGQGDNEKKRLKKNAREQKRAHKINDQISILRALLEEANVETQNTKSSVLTGAIGLLRNLLLTDEKSLSTSNNTDVMSMSISRSADMMASDGVEEPYKLLFRKSGTPLAVASPDNAQFIDCNGRFCEVFGCSPSEIRGKPAYNFIRDNEVGQLDDVLDRALQPLSAEDVPVPPLEVVLTNPKGQRFLVRVTALRDDDESVQYLLFTPKAVFRGQSGELGGAGPACVPPVQQATVMPMPLPQFYSAARQPPAGSPRQQQSSNGAVSTQAMGMMA